MITLLGGLCWMPIAVRSSDSTTTMRTKLVTMMRIDGASDRTVIRATSWTSALGQAGALTEIDVDICCAAAGSTRAPRARGKQRRKSGGSEASLISIPF